MWFVDIFPGSQGYLGNFGFEKAVFGIIGGEYKGPCNGPKRIFLTRTEGSGKDYLIFMTTTPMDK